MAEKITWGNPSLSEQSVVVYAENNGVEIQDADLDVIIVQFDEIDSLIHALKEAKMLLI